MQLRRVHQFSTLAPILPIEELKPADGEDIVIKNYPGWFTGTNSAEILENTNRKKIVLVGYMAHVCVSSTARQGHKRGWDAIVAKDAVGDRDIPGVNAEELTRVALCEIADFCGTIIQSKEIS